MTTKGEDGGALTLLGIEAQKIPIDGDLAAADAEKSAEIDHSGPWLAGAVHDDVGDESEPLAIRREDTLAQNSDGFAGIERLEIARPRRVGLDGRGRRVGIGLRDCVLQAPRRRARPRRAA